MQKTSYWHVINLILRKPKVAVFSSMLYDFALYRFINFYFPKGINSREIPVKRIDNQEKTLDAVNNFKQSNEL